MTKQHYLRRVIEGVDKTHPKLGKLVAVSMLTVKAKKLLLVVSPRGCGKSAASNYVGKSHPRPLMRDRLSVAGLSSLADILTGFDGVIVVDDIAKTQTPYARIGTITTLAELIYSHYCSSNLAKMTYDITDFYAAGIVNIQPVLLRSLVMSQEWEASVQDKTLRYYHLMRPLEPNPEPPALKLEWGLSFDATTPPRLTGKLSEALQREAEPQWGLSRLKEHLRDLLRAAAALDKRRTVTQADYRLLLDVMKPCQIEKLVMDKTNFESQRYLHSNKLAVLTEYLTYGQFTLQTIARDYKVSESQAYRLMNEQLSEWVVVAKSPTTYGPSEKLEKELRRLSLI